MSVSLKRTNSALQSSDHDNVNDDEEECLQFHRDLNMLYVHKTTLDCAVNSLCIPCLYKIFPDGSAFGMTLPPNQRPEMCRHSSLDSIISMEGLYETSRAQILPRRVLTIGDGDFSFSLALAQSIHFDRLVATSYESNESVLSVYKNAEQNIRKLREIGGEVMHDVDGKNIQESLCGVEYENSFDFIIWNFPCIRIMGGADAQAADIEENKDLVKCFFSSAKRFLRQPPSSSMCTADTQLSFCGEIHITHKTFEPFCWWNIVNLAAESDFCYRGSVIFDRYLYPGYINRKALDNKSFPFFDAQVKSNLNVSFLSNRQGNFFEICV